MSRLRLLLALTALPLLLWAVVPVVSGGQSLQSKIQKKQGQIQGKKAKEQVLTTTISGYTKKIDGLQRDISALQARQVALQSDLDRERAQLQQIQDELRRERIRLARLKARLTEARTALAARLVALYKADEPDIVTVVLESDGFADLVERAEFLRRISDQDTRIIDNVRDAKADATAATKRLGGLEDRQQRVTAGVAAKRDQVASVKGTLVSRRDEYAQVRAAKQDALSSTRSERVDLEGDLHVLEKEQARIASTLRQAGSGAGNGINPTVNGPIKQGTGRFIWPVNGPIASPFGMRWGKLHAGIDIAVPIGTPIHAADGGTVAIAGWVSGYGNYTCIAHSGGLSTCYGHQSRFATSVGANVSQGQLIGYSGCTGHCLGPHVHFEIRINGTPVDPMGYL